MILRYDKVNAKNEDYFTKRFKKIKLYPDSMKDPDLLDIYHRLYSFYGESKWWPAKTPFEVMIGAILTQQTIWRNVEKSINKLNANGLLEIETLAEEDIGVIEECIRQSGFFRQKARRLKLMASHILKHYNGDLDEFFAQDIDTLRTELLGLDGIGPETADSILLYADSKAKFVIDAYTFRIFKRIGIDFLGKYNKTQEYFETNLPSDVRMYRNYHAFIVELAKDFCKIKPECPNCPLNEPCNYYLTGK
jgi:endonuclease-3 related protein